ncbi:MAG: alpha/beta hydrolase [Pseudomonadota bacterium]
MTALGFLHRPDGAKPPDGPGAPIAVRQAGPGDAPAILLLHGWSQSSAVFQKQLAGPLAARWRLIAPDFSGHGATPFTGDAAAIADGTVWARDIADVIGALGLRRPVLVGWSMGGWAIGDYLARHGAGALGGIVTIGSLARVGAPADSAMMAKRKADVRAEGMFDPDPAVQIEAAITFARAMTAAPLSKRDLAFLVAQMMACTPAVRRAARLRDADWRPAFAAAAALPSLVIQGGAERVCPAPMAEETRAALAAEMLTIPGAGHMPFWEQSAIVDAAIDRLAETVHP